MVYFEHFSPSPHNSFMWFPFLSVCLSSAGYYVKVMKKVLEKGSEYVKNESERLGRILSESNGRREGY